MADCRLCGAPVVFMRTRAGKMIPIDSNLRVDNALDLDATVRFEDLRDSLGASVVVSHFVTCEDAEKWRKKRPNK